MTVSELRIKRDQIVKSLGIARTQFGDRSVQYADQKTALEIIDREITTATEIESGAQRTRFSLAGFSRG
jgi:hypothetical protein